MTVKVITSKQEFDADIKENKLVVVDFSATWCGPCKMISPYFENLSGDHAEIKFLKVDVDDVPEVAQEYKVTAMPTFLFFKDGEKINDLVGATPQKLLPAVTALKTQA